MAYVKVTDGGVIRFLNTSTPSGRTLYNELMDGYTGYSVVVDEAGNEKEFTEDQVKATLEKARIAAGKRKIKVQASVNKSVPDEE